MPTFTYTARDQKGSMQTGNLEALSEDQVVSMLQHRGLLVTSISLKDLSVPAVAKPAARARARSRKRPAGVSPETDCTCPASL